VDIISKGGGQVRVFKSNSGGSDKDLLPYPLVVKPEDEIDYFLVREGFQVMSLVKNPMAIMIGITLLMTLVLPKMMASIDPEALQEMTNPTTTGTDGQPIVREPPPKWCPPPIHSKDK